jgi:pilus assembly protein Flp/PilA
MNIHYGSTGVRSLMRRFFSDESGATATEYAMLIIFIALAIAGGATLLGNNINNLFSSIGASLSGLSP